MWYNILTKTQFFFLYIYIVDGKLICVHDHHDFEQSKEEREYLITLAKPHMVKSTVVDAETGRSTESRYAFFNTRFCTSIADLMEHIYIYIYIYIEEEEEEGPALV